METNRLQTGYILAIDSTQRRQSRDRKRQNGMGMLWQRNADDRNAVTLAFSL